MIRTATCPSDSSLQRYAQGWSDPASTMEVDEHLTVCANCEERLSRIEAQRTTDGLIESLRWRGQWSAEHGSNESSELLTDVNAVDTSNAVDSGFAQVLAEIEAWPLERLNVSDPALPLPRQLGQYELLELIGQGGTAQVYRARHSKLQRTVAIKLLNVPKWQVDRSLARLEREIAVVGQLHHPAIVAATDAGQHEGTPYLVTEYIDGLNLSQLARAAKCRGSLRDPSEVRGANHDTGPSMVRGANHDNHTANVCEAIRVAALGLAHAHAQGVTHRDIKPSNLMIDRQGQVKILDFGLVHLEGWQDEALELTTVGQLLGTLDYMAPEQADKATSVDHRSDIYALGATLFRLLCGRAPYAASLYQSPLEKLRLLAMTDPPKVQTLRPDLPVELAELVNQTLNRDPAKRPPSAAHLAEALMPFCDGHRLGDWVQWAIANPPAPLANEPPVSVSGRPGREFPSDADVEIKPRSIRDGRNDRGRGGRWPWVLAAAGGAAAIWLSIVLILDTQKGQLVIESESADVRVTLRKDGQESETLQLEPGLNQTRVYAGTYQIEIDGPADAYQLDRETIVIKRGEVVLAKVGRKPGIESQATAPTVPSANSSEVPTQTLVDEPTYKGYPFSHWAAVFRNEREPSIRIDAFKNMKSLGDPIPLLIEVIVASNRGPRQDIGSLLQSLYNEYFSEDQWAQIEESIKDSETTTHIDSIIELSHMVKIYAVNHNRQLVQDPRLYNFLAITTRISDQFAHKWSSESRTRLIDTMVPWLTASDGVNEEFRSKMFTIVGNCLRGGNIDRKTWLKLSNRDFIQANSELRRLAIAALMGDSDRPCSAEPEAVYGLMAAASLMEEASEMRVTLFQRVDQTLKSASPAELNATVPELDRLSGTTLRFFDSNAGQVENSVPNFFPQEMNINGAIAPSIPAEFSFDVSGNQVLTGHVNQNATVGELLVALWKLLASDQHFSEPSILDELLEKTRTDQANFVEKLREQLAPNFQQAKVSIKLENVTVERPAYDKDGKLVRRKRTFGGLTLGELPENHFSAFVDSVWNRLDFEREKLVMVGTISGPIRFTTEMDFNDDQHVSWEELYQFLFGQHPTQPLEGLTPEVVHGMLLHRHLLTLLGRPLPTIDFGDATLSTETEHE